MAVAKAIVIQPKTSASSNTLSSKGKVMNLSRKITARKVTAFAMILSLTFSTLFQSTMALASPLFKGIESPVVLPEATAGKEYSYQFQAEGGLPPLTWQVIRGELPQDLNLTPSGKLHGLLTQSQPKTYRLVIEVMDSTPTPQRFSQEFSLTVQAPPLRIVTGQKLTEPSLRITTAVTPQPQVTVTPIADSSLEAVTTASGTNAKGTSSTVVRQASPAEEPIPCPSSTPTLHRVWGRLRPASLDSVIAQILRDPVLGNKNEVREELKKARFIPDEQTNGTSKPDAQKDGTNEKAAIIRLLQSLLPPSTSPGASKDESVITIQQAQKLRQQSPIVSEERIKKLLDLLTNYNSNIVVRAENKGGQIMATATTNRDGEYGFCLPESDADKTKDNDDHYVISSGADNFYTKKIIAVTNADLHVSLTIEDRPVSLLTRAVVGYQQAGAASTAFEQNYFFDLFVSQSLPFQQKIDPDFGEPFRIWGAIRAISAPQSGNVTIGDLSTNFVTKVSELKANEAARVFDYLGGIEYRLPFFANRSLLPSFDRQTKQKFTLSFIAGGGFVTPTNPNETQPKTYKISDQFRTRFKNESKGSELLMGDELDGKDYVSFVPTDRDRFFRQYYAGFRMQTFFFNRHDVPLQRFPVQLDLQYGINEYVTGGRVRGGVLRLDGYFPLPYDSLNFINLFGTAIFRPVRSNIEKTLILEEVDGKFFDAKTATLPVTQFNRDYYRVGVGIDFVSFVGKLLKNK